MTPHRGGAAGKENLAASGQRSALSCQFVGLGASRLDPELFIKIEKIGSLVMQVSGRMRRLRYLDRPQMRQAEIYGAVALGGLIFLIIVLRGIIG